MESSPQSRPSQDEIQKLKELGYFYSEPFAQWNYPHLITSEGGVIPWNYLILETILNEEFPKLDELSGDDN
jgi:hypothetical protein